jgi:uncharacterized protein YndB with AHSA1/START domain
LVIADDDSVRGRQARPANPASRIWPKKELLLTAGYPTSANRQRHTLTPVTSDLRGSTAIEFPNSLEIVFTRDYDAPVELVFDVLTKTEHVRNTIAPFGETVTVCSIDLRVGGDYHYVFMPDDVTECSFRGTFLEVDAPTRTAQTWHFDGWPDVEAVESVDLVRNGAGTTMTLRIAFRDQAGRDHMGRTDGYEANFDILERYLNSLLKQ